MAINKKINIKRSQTLSCGLHYYRGLKVGSYLTSMFQDLSEAFYYTSQALPVPTEVNFSQTCKERRMMEKMCNSIFKK